MDREKKYKINKEKVCVKINVLQWRLLTVLLNTLFQIIKLVKATIWLLSHETHHVLYLDWQVYA